MSVVVERRRVELLASALRARRPALQIETLNAAIQRGEWFHFLAYIRNRVRGPVGLISDTSGVGGAEEGRTPGLRIANAALCQLSYCPTLQQS